MHDSELSKAYREALQRKLEQYSKPPQPRSSPTTKQITLPESVLRITRPIFFEELDKEIANILSSPIARIMARVVPTISKTGFQEGKLIETAVLYVDIRNSSTITSGHNEHNAAKIYRAFFRAMCKISRRNSGVIANFAGDRLMVVFDPSTDAAPCDTAMNTAIMMHSFLATKLNPRLSAAVNHPISFGVGIDFGKMLTIRVGQQGEGNSGLVWSGNPANFASKLADEGSGIFVSKTALLKMKPDFKKPPHAWTKREDPRGTFYIHTQSTHE